MHQKRHNVWFECNAVQIFIMTIPDLNRTIGMVISQTNLQQAKTCKL